MILKIARYKDKQKWWIYDSIRKISISTPYICDGDYAELPQAHNWDSVFFDVGVRCDCRTNGKVPEENCDDCVRYYVLNCRMDNGEEYLIAFDTIAYILNDNGKTIDKIVANYNTEPNTGTDIK